LAAFLVQGPALVGGQSVSTVDDAEIARVIVRFRVDSSLLGESGLSATAVPAVRAAALGLRLELPMSAGVAVSDRSQVVFAAGITSAATGRARPRISRLSTRSRPQAR
jgi:hypothetical protein